MPSTTTPTPANLDQVNFVRQELSEMTETYREIRDCVERRVKAKRDLYLPVPFVEEDKNENTLRYEAYIKRAVFYNVTGRTLSALVGQIFSRPPEVILPKMLESMKDDATGRNVSLEQLAKDAGHWTVGYGRSGVFTDFPKTDGVVTRKQLLDGTVKPRLSLYGPENITNWQEEVRKDKFTGKSRLMVTLIVLTEDFDVPGRFNTTRGKLFRELRLNDKQEYTMQTWTEADGVIKALEPEYTPTDSKGEPFNEIPFEPIGSINNDLTIDPAPMGDMAELNIGHFRNSADFEESCFIVGQPTLVISNLTVEWYEDVFDSKDIYMGSRRAIMLPENGQAQIIQAQPNSLPQVAMTQKEAQMVALGAKLVENRQVRRTATETGITSAAESSVLATCANNVSAAFTRALKHAYKFIAADDAEIKFLLNTDYAFNTMSQEERVQTMADFVGGLLSFTEARAVLRRGGVAVQDDVKAKAEIDTDKEAAAAREIKVAQESAPPPAPGAAAPKAKAK